MATVKLNAENWNSLSADQQSQITTILQSTGLFKDRDSIESDPNTLTAARSELEPQSWWTDIRGSVCRAGCATAEAAAVAACTALSGGVAIAACVAAAHAAAEICRNECPA